MLYISIPCIKSRIPHIPSQEIHNDVWMQQTNELYLGGLPWIIAEAQPVENYMNIG